MSCKDKKPNLKELEDYLCNFSTPAEVGKLLDEVLIHYALDNITKGEDVRWTYNGIYNLYELRSIFLRMGGCDIGH